MHVKGFKYSTSKIGPRTSGYATKNMPLWYTDYFEKKLAKQQMQEDDFSEFLLSA